MSDFRSGIFFTWWNQMSLNMEQEIHQVEVYDYLEFKNV